MEKERVDIYHSSSTLCYKYLLTGLSPPLYVSSSFISNTSNKLLLRTYHVQGTEIGNGHTVINKTHTDMALGLIRLKDSWEDRQSSNYKLKECYKMEKGI